MDRAGKVRFFGGSGSGLTMDLMDGSTDGWVDGGWNNY
jgi:hypothetical protein